ncbi:hypothetical protein TNCV_3595111 [Trichonephila clavipes]|nr:hypothetical protein TNCV_3595111 [Trichonephila clavipes]
MDFDPDTKRKNEKWHSPRRKKAQMSKFNIKSMLIRFLYFDKRGIIHKEFVPPEQTFNQVFMKMYSKGPEKGNYPKEFDGHTEDYTCRRLPALPPTLVTTSPSVRS